MLYNSGTGVAQDDEQSVEWFLKAAKQGYANAQHGLGLAYRNGIGVAQDDEQAVEWCLKAAKQGHVGAKSSLALFKMLSKLKIDGQDSGLS